MDGLPPEVDPRIVAPVADDVVLVLGESSRHDRLRDLDDADRFTYRGQIFDAIVVDESMQVTYTGQTNH